MQRDPMGLAIVTGASSGIGWALALQLAAEGHDVLAVARTDAKLRELATAVAATGSGAAVHTLALDVTAPGAAIAIRDRARALGGAAWLLNVAGAVLVGRVDESDPDACGQLVRLNCESLTTITAAVLPDLVAAGRGRVLNVASLSAFQPTPFWATYGATKAFVLSFSEALSEELRGTGVTATALCPGPVTTRFFAATEGAAARRAPRHEISAEACARAGLAAARRGRAIVIPGLWNRMQVWGERLAPRSIVRRVAARTGLGHVGMPRLPPRRAGARGADAGRTDATATEP